MQRFSQPHPNSYHVPGSRLIAGEYPFSWDREAGVEKLRAFIRAGVTYFLDLTEENELAPYAAELARESGAAGSELVYHRLPVRDMDIPTPERMREILDAIELAESQGHMVFVHCWGGIGRTGTVVGCYLVRKGASGDDALRQVSSLYGTMSPEKVRRHPESPQTSHQTEFVRGWKEPA